MNLIAVIGGVVLTGIILLILLSSGFFDQVSKSVVDFKEITERTAPGIADTLIDSAPALAELCGLEQTIRTNLDQSLIDTIPNDTWEHVKTKNLLRKILLGETILDSEYQIIFDVLSIAHKKKLNIGDLEISCNLISTP